MISKNKPAYTWCPHCGRPSREIETRSFLRLDDETGLPSKDDPIELTEYQCIGSDHNGCGRSSWA